MHKKRKARHGRLREDWSLALTRDAHDPRPLYRGGAAKGYVDPTLPAHRFSAWGRPVSFGRFAGNFPRRVTILVFGGLKVNRVGHGTGRRPDRSHAWRVGSLVMVPRPSRPIGLRPGECTTYWCIRQVLRHSERPHRTFDACLPGWPWLLATRVAKRQEGLRPTTWPPPVGRPPAAKQGDSWGPVGPATSCGCAALVASHHGHPKKASAKFLGRTEDLDSAQPRRC